MARQAGNKVTIKLADGTKVKAEFAVDLASATQQQLLEVARNGYMNRVRAIIGSAIQNHAGVCATWETQKKSVIAFCKKNAGKMDAELTLSLMKAQLMAQNPGIDPDRELPKKWEFTLDDLLSVEEEEGGEGEE